MVAETPEHRRRALRSELCGYLTRQAVHAEAIGAIWGKTKFDRGIREAHAFGKRLTHHRVNRQLEQPSASLSKPSSRPEHSIPLDRYHATWPP